MGRARQSSARRFLKIVPRRVRSDVPYLAGPSLSGKRRGIGLGRAVSRILSAPNFFGGENHLSVQPIPGIRFAFAKPGAGRSGIPYLALHPMGFSVPRRLRFARCALTAPFHPCRRRLRNTGGLIFCGTFRRKAFQLSARVYLRSKPGLRGIAPCGVRTFLPRLAPGAILRPSKTTEIITKTVEISRRQTFNLVDRKSVV